MEQKGVLRLPGQEKVQMCSQREKGKTRIIAAAINLSTDISSKSSWLS